MGLHTISMFTGIAGLDIGVERAFKRFGIDVRTACYVEREAFSIAHLVSKIKAGKLADAPIWTDVRSFDARAWSSKVDLVIAGFPCQDISDAGKRKGIRDGEKSSLWKQVVRVACESRARFICLENVAAITFRGLDDVLRDLAKAGYDAIWACLSVDEVGGTQKRERWFCLAYANDCGLSRLGLQQRGETVYTAPSVAKVVAGRGTDSMGATMRPRRDTKANEGRDRLLDAWEAGHAMDWPPRPTDIDGWREFRSQGLLAEPAIPRTPDGIPARVDRTRALGNAVCPAQADYAFTMLISKLIESKNQGFWEDRNERT